MIQTLQKKFIFSAMIAVTAVMVLFLASINLVNLYTVRSESDRTMEMVLGEHQMGPSDRTDEINSPEPPGIPEGEDGSMAEPPEKPEGEDGSVAEPPEKPGGDVPQERRTGGFSMLSAIVPGGGDLSLEQYFFVRLNGDGEVLYTDISHVASLEEEDAETYAQEALAAGTESGRVSGYLFRCRTDEETGSKTFAFLDERSERRNLIRTLAVTALVGAVGWFLVLFLVIYLSKRAIRPIAENIERQKQFVTDAGHEIKTPLAIISANADVLELHMGENKWIRNIRSQTERLGQLTQNLLLLSRMEEGNAASLAPEVFPASAVFEETGETYREIAEGKGVSLTIRTPEEPCEICLSRDAYTRLLDILFENASKYVREGGYIEAELTRATEKRSGRRKDGIEFRIRNNCEQALSGDPERLFDRFYRSDEARTQKSGGSGIGLSVARAIAEGMGGSIHASYGTSSGEDVTDEICFTVKIPSAT